MCPVQHLRTPGALVSLAVVQYRLRTAAQERCGAGALDAAEPFGDADF